MHTLSYFAYRSHGQFRMFQLCLSALSTIHRGKCKQCAAIAFIYLYKCLVQTLGLKLSLTLCIEWLMCQTSGQHVNKAYNRENFSTDSRSSGNWSPVLFEKLPASLSAETIFIHILQRQQNTFFFYQIVVHSKISVSFFCLLAFQYIQHTGAHFHITCHLHC